MNTWDREAMRADMILIADLQQALTGARDEVERLNCELAASQAAEVTAERSEASAQGALVALRKRVLDACSSR